MRQEEAQAASKVASTASMLATSQPTNAANDGWLSDDDDDIEGGGNE